MNGAHSKEGRAGNENMITVNFVWINEGETALDKCVGCSLCEMACSLRHHGVCGSYLSGIRVTRKESEWLNKASRRILDITVCNQCGSCLQVCPEGALRRIAETGAIVVDDEKCSRCIRCIKVCPSGALWYTGKGRSVKLIKCDLCSGHEDGPRCIEWCPRGILQLSSYAATP